MPSFQQMACKTGVRFFYINKNQNKNINKNIGYYSVKASSSSFFLFFNNNIKSSMASSEMKIPTIDFCKQDLKPGTSQWESTKTRVFQALQEYGCFEAIYDKVPREAMIDTTKEIFEFPLETKLKYKSTIPRHGYLTYPDMPSYECLAIDDVFKPQSVESLVNIFWPDGDLNFCNVLNSYSKSVVVLDQMVKRMILESLGLKRYIDEFLDSCFYNIKFTHYNAVKVEEGEKRGLNAHTDSGFLTIISQNQVNALQVVLKKNGEWIEVSNNAPNSFIVLSGDSFMAWTNGRLHSPTHKVTLIRDSERFSIPLFALPKPGYTIKAPKELVDEQHPLLFKPYNFLELYEYMAFGPGRTTRTKAFKAFCGI